MSGPEWFHIPHCNPKCSLEYGHWFTSWADDVDRHAHEAEVRPQCAACKADSEVKP